MSQENSEVVRKPLRVGEGSSRPFDQRLTLRFPRLADAYARFVIARLPPSSRFRQVAVSRASRLGMEAFNRRDVEAAVSYAHPDFEFAPPREFVDLGFERSYRGPAGFRKYISTWSEVFGPDLRVEPVELVDARDRIVLLADLRARGQASGIPFNGTIATVSLLRHGKATHVQAFFDHVEALEAAGVRK
jgi:ketosteroid isomerase-like protein